MTPRRIALVRHPEADIAPGICYGRLDTGLAPGASQTVTAIVEALLDLRPIRIWTSPSIRCRIVADAVGAALATPVQTEPRLMELDFGTWEGVAWDAVPRADLDRWAAEPETFAPGGGETARALAARVDAALREIVLDPNDLVIVTHGGPLRVLMALVHGRPLDVLAAAPPLGSVEIVTQGARPGR